MFPGSPAPLPPDTPLHLLLSAVPRGALTGAWARGCRLRLIHGPGGRRVLCGPDLGRLLRRCGGVVVRDGGAMALVPASRLIGLRVLEIVLGAPFLPPPVQLRTLFPRSSAGPDTLIVPLGLGSAEEALAFCLHARVPVVSSRIAYRATSG